MGWAPGLLDKRAMIVLSHFYFVLKKMGRAGQLPDGSSREVSVGAAGGWAGAGVVKHGDEGVGRVADHGLQVKAVLGERRDGQGPLPARTRRQPRTRETRACEKEECETLKCPKKVDHLLILCVFGSEASAKFLKKLLQINEGMFRNAFLFDFIQTLTQSNPNRWHFCQSSDKRLFWLSVQLSLDALLAFHPWANMPFMLEKCSDCVW